MSSNNETPQPPSQEEHTEPVSGKQGQGTKEEPFDQGNQEEEDAVSRANDDKDIKEPVSGERGKAAFDKGNEAG